MKNEPNIKRNALLDRIYEQSVKMSGVKVKNDKHKGK